MRAKSDRPTRPSRVNLYYRERLERYCVEHPAPKPWKPDFRDGLGLERMLIALCIAVPVLALLIVKCGEP